MIQVICADIASLSREDYLALFEKASPERKEKAQRYSHPEDALRCVAAEALLRFAAPGGDWILKKTEAGKPYLKGREDFRFNLSHSGNWVVTAWGSSPVGVDVECCHRKNRVETVTRRMFAPEEQAYVFRETEDITRRFFEIWTAKESYIKYLGTGLQTDLRSFSVLSLEAPLRIHRKSLPGDYLVAVCTEEETVAFSILDGKELL